MRFGRSLLFAAVAAGALPVSVWLLGGWLGTGSALALHLAAAAVGYLVTISPTPRAAFGVGLLAAVLMGILLALPIPLSGIAAGTAGVIGMCRSGWLYRGRPLRAIALESALLLSGLLVASTLAGHDLASLALATWGFYLVQSLFSLAAGFRARESGDGDLDPFDRARAGLLALLD